MEEKFFLEWEEVKKLGVEKSGCQKTSAGGITLFSDGFNQVIADGEDNCMVVGPTGSGKTRSFGIELLENLIDAQESFLSVDAKNTSYRYTFNYAKAAGYKIVVLNFRDPLKSQAQFWNPLGDLWDMYNSGEAAQKDKAMQRLLDIADCIFQEEGEKDPFWNRSARSLFVGICLALFMHGRKAQATLYHAYRMAVDGEKRVIISSSLKMFFENIVGVGTEAYQYASGYILAPNETRGGILSTYLDRMSLFSGLSIRNLLCHEGFGIQGIKDEEKVGIYVILPDESRKFHQIGAMFIKLLYQHYIDLAESQGGSCRKRFNFVIDEFGNMNIPDAEMMFSAIRSRNGRIYIFIQTLEQLFSQYGKEKGTVIKDNCGLQYYYATPNLVTLKELEELSGQRMIQGESGNVYMKPVLSVRELHELPKRYVLVRFHGQQYIAYFPDISEYKDRICEYADFNENVIQPLEEFDINKIVMDYEKKKALEQCRIEETAQFSKEPFFRDSLGSLIPCTVEICAQENKNGELNEEHKSEEDDNDIDKQMEKLLEQIKQTVEEKEGE